MAKKQNMTLVYVAIAVVLALFLLYVFFSMSKESFEGATCDESIAKKKLEIARKKLVGYQTQCAGCQSGESEFCGLRSNQTKIEEAIRKADKVLATYV